MKKFILLLTLVCVCGFGACNTTKSSDEDKDIAKVVSSKEYDILFDYANIDSIYYCEDDSCVIIHYSDPDVFDYDNLAFETGRDNWYGDYVRLNVNDSLIFDFIFNYQNWKEEKDYWHKDSLSNQYTIVEEDLTFDDGTVDIIFWIKRNEGE